MNLNNLKHLLRTKYPPVSLALSPDRVSAVRLDRKTKNEIRLGGYLIQPLPEGLVINEQLNSTVTNEGELTGIISDVLKRLAPGLKEITVVLPDYYTKVNILDVEEIPGNRDDVLELIKWKMEKKLPLPLDELFIDYDVLSSEKGTLISVLIKKDLVGQIDRIFDSLDIHAGQITITSANLINLYMEREHPESDSIHIYADREGFSLSFMNGGTVSLYRSKERRTSKRDFSDILVKEVRTSAVFLEDSMEKPVPEVCYANLLIENREEVKSALSGLLGSDAKDYDFRNIIPAADGVVVEEGYVPFLSAPVGAVLSRRS